MTTPDRTARARPGPGNGRDEAGVTAVSAFGGREAARLYADQFEIYHGNSNPEPRPEDLPLPRHASRASAEVFQFANENIFVKILENVREKDVFLVQPT